jgi:hypothetical protein
MANNLINRNIAGRPKGTPNKITKALKDMILGALDDNGGQAYLAEQAQKNPKAFLSLLGRVLPSEIKTTISTTESLSDEELDAKINALLGKL